MASRSALIVKNTGVFSIAGTAQIVIRAPPAVVVSNGGSLSFDPTESAQLTASVGSDWNVGTGDYTIEWWQQATNDLGTRYVFKVGNLAVSQFSQNTTTGNNVTLWSTSSGGNNFGSMGEYQNQWVHYAFTRSSSSLRAFVNGTQIGSTQTNTVNVNSSGTLQIGSKNGSTEYFSGLITNFNFIKGTAKYTSNFTVPSSPISADANSKLLLLATSSGTYLDDSSGEDVSVTNPSSLVTWSSSNPYE